MHCSPPGSSVRGLPCPAPGDLPNPGIEPRSPALQLILYQLSQQGSPRILEWIAYPFSSGSSQPRNQGRVSWIAGKFFTNWAIREALIIIISPLPPHGLDLRPTSSEKRLELLDLSFPCIFPVPHPLKPRLASGLLEERQPWRSPPASASEKNTTGSIPRAADSKTKDHFPSNSKPCPSGDSQVTKECTNPEAHQALLRAWKNVTTYIGCFWEVCARFSVLLFLSSVITYFHIISTVWRKDLVFSWGKSFFIFNICLFGCVES